MLKDRGKNFKKFDLDRDGDLDVDEVAAALTGFTDCQNAIEALEDEQKAHAVLHVTSKGSVGAIEASDQVKILIKELTHVDLNGATLARALSSMTATQIKRSQNTRNPQTKYPAGIAAALNPHHSNGNISGTSQHGHHHHHQQQQHYTNQNADYRYGFEGLIHRDSNNRAGRDSATAPHKQMRSQTGAVINEPKYFVNPELDNYVGHFRPLTGSTVTTAVERLQSPTHPHGSTSSPPRTGSPTGSGIARSATQGNTGDRNTGIIREPVVPFPNDELPMRISGPPPNSAANSQLRALDALPTPGMSESNACIPP